MEDELNSSIIQRPITDTHWSLNSRWLARTGLRKIPGTYIDVRNRKQPPFQIDDIWQYIRNLYTVFPEPNWLSLDFDTNSSRTLAPVWQMIPHMTELITLELKCHIQPVIYYDSEDYDYYESESEETESMIQ